MTSCLVCQNTAILAYLVRYQPKSLYDGNTQFKETGYCVMCPRWSVLLQVFLLLLRLTLSSRFASSRCTQWAIIASSFLADTAKHWWSLIHARGDGVSVSTLSENVMPLNSELILHPCTQLYGRDMECARVFKRLQGILDDEFRRYIHEPMIVFHGLLAYNPCSTIPKCYGRYIRYPRLSSVPQKEPFTGAHPVSARTAIHTVQSDVCNIV